MQFDKSRSADGRRYINNDRPRPTKEEIPRPRMKTRDELMTDLKEQVAASTGDPDYAESVAFLVRRSGIASVKLEQRLSRGSIVHETSKLFPLPKVDGGATYPITPYLETDVTLTAPPNAMPDAQIVAGPTPKYTLGCSYKGECSLFRTTKVEKENAHYHTSLLKRYLSCTIRMNDWYSVSLVGQEWLNQVGKNGVVITGAFITPYVARFMDKLTASGRTFLFVTEKYHPGLYIGDQYSYYCDPRGTVLGCSRGAKATFWHDKSDPWGSIDYVKNYKIETYASFGTQRIVLMKPCKNIVVPAPFEVVHAPPSFYMASDTILDEAKQPNFMCALVRVQEEEDLGLPEDKLDDDDVILALDLRDAENVAKLPEVPTNFIINTIENPRRYKWRIIWSSGHLALVALINPMAMLALVALTILCLTIYYQFFKWWNTVDQFHLTLTGDTIKFYGRHADIARSWYKRNKTDSRTRLPYGWYHVHEFGIVQVRQGSALANYTNVPRLIQPICSSMNWPSTSTVSHYHNLTMAAAPAFTFKGNFEVMTQKDPEIEIMMAAYDIRVNAPGEKQSLDIHLANDESFRSYVTALINRTTILASATKRVARAGVRSIYPAEHHKDLVMAMWNDQSLGRIDYWDSYPDLSEYKGKKLRKYEMAVENKMGFDDDARYTTFIKSEALPEESVCKKGNRVITMNDPAFNNRTLNWMKQFEHKILSMKDPRTGLDLIAKGSNCDKRSEIILTLSDIFSYVASIDFKNCDGHFTGSSYEGMIQAFGEIGLPKEDVTSILNAKTYGVIEYQNPQQSSGDLYTGSANCTLVSSMLYPFLSDDFTFYCDGDDTLLFYNKPQILTEIETHLTLLGFEISFDCVQETDTSLWSEMEIPFCQTFYTTRGYHVDINRRINKLMNITSSNLIQSARTVLGKLQGLEMLSALGVNLHMDVRGLVSGKSENPDIVQLEKQYAGLESYAPDQEVDFDLTKPETGVVAACALAIKKDLKMRTMRLFHANDTKAYHRRTLALIEKELSQVINYQEEPETRPPLDEDRIATLMTSDRVFLASNFGRRRHVPHVDL